GGFVRADLVRAKTFAGAARRQEHRGAFAVVARTARRRAFRRVLARRAARLHAGEHIRACRTAAVAVLVGLRERVGHEPRARRSKGRGARKRAGQAREKAVGAHSVSTSMAAMMPAAGRLSTKTNSTSGTGTNPANAALPTR